MIVLMGPRGGGALPSFLLARPPARHDAPVRRHALREHV